LTIYLKMNNIDRIWQVVEMPLDEKYQAVVRYCEANGLETIPGIDRIANHRGMECLLNRAYMHINKPHSIEQ